MNEKFGTILHIIQCFALTIIAISLCCIAQKIPETITMGDLKVKQAPLYQKMEDKIPVFAIQSRDSKTGSLSIDFDGLPEITFRPGEILQVDVGGSIDVSQPNGEVWNFKIEK